MMTLRKLTTPILAVLLLGFTVTLPACQSTNGEKPQAFTGQSDTHASTSFRAGPPGKGAQR
jgi:hypothetical protein